MKKLLLLLLLSFCVPIYSAPSYATVVACDGEDRYIGNGSTVAFTYSCKILSSSDLKVLVNGVLKVLTTDYTVSGVGNSAGGTVTFVTAPANTLPVTILRNQPISQLTNYQANSSYNALTVMRDFDKQTMVGQMLTEKYGRALRLAEKSTYSGLTVPDPVALNGIRWKADLTGLENFELVTAGVGGVTAADLANTSDAAKGDALVGFKQPVSGATARTVHAKLLERFSVKDFGALCDGVNDDTAEIQAAIDYLESTGFGAELYFPEGSCLISAKLTIEKSNISLVGAGNGHQHDVGSGGDYGTRLLWNGTAAGTMLEIAPVVGASARRISGGGVRGIGFYCLGSARAGIAILANSVNDALFDFYAEDCSDTVMRLGVVATLGEARDSQHNTISIFGKQVLTGSGKVLELTGDATANASFNVFPMIQGLYLNSTAINLINADNNLFVQTRLFRFPGGTGVGVISHGGATEGVSSRANRFVMLSPHDGGVTLKGTPAYTVATTGIIVDTYDSANGAPAVTVETDAELILSDYTGRTQIIDVGWIRSANTLDFFGNTGNKTVFRMSPLATGDSFLTVSHGAGTTLLSALGTPANINLGLFVKGTGIGTLSDGNAATKVGWNNTGIGFFATAPIAAPTIAAAGTDAGTTQTLANSIRTILINYGLVVP